MQCRTKTRRTGSSIVEFALVVPVLIALLLGIVEFGILVKNRLTLANASREGARSASLGSTTSQIRTRVQNAARPLDVSTSGVGSVTIEQSLDGTTYTAVLADLTSANAVPQGYMVRVTARTKHRSLTSFFPFLNNRFLESNSAFRRE